MYLEWHPLLLGKPYTALFLTYLWRIGLYHYWVYHTQYHHNLHKTLQRIYTFLKEHYQSQGSLLDNLFRKPIILYYLSILLSECLSQLSCPSRISPKCFYNEIVSTLLLLNVIETELSLLVLFQKQTSWACLFGSWIKFHFPLKSPVTYFFETTI